MKILKWSAIFPLLTSILVVSHIQLVNTSLAYSGNQSMMTSWNQSPVISHSDMAMEIGTPAIIQSGQDYPVITVYPSSDGELLVNIVKKSGVMYRMDDPVDQSDRKSVV